MHHICNIWVSDLSIRLLATEAGRKTALAASASYPLQFGMEIAALVPARGDRPDPDYFPEHTYEGDDHLGSLDDFLKGRKHCWWRKWSDKWFQSYCDHSCGKNHNHSLVWYVSLLGFGIASCDAPSEIILLRWSWNRWWADGENENVMRKTS